MGFWGAPNHLKDHAQKACMAAVRCIEFINHLNDNWIRQNQDPLVTRIGLHTGEVIVGNMGYDERMNYTVLGDSVNLASRLEGLNKYYGTSIIISEVTYQAAGNYIAARKIDVVAVKGKSQGVTIYELIGLTSDLDKFKLNEISDFNTAFELYLNRKWKHAAQIFNDIYIRSDKKDKPAEILIARCNQYSNEPPDENWNGIYIFKTK